MGPAIEMLKNDMKYYILPSNFAYEELSDLQITIKVLCHNATQGWF